MKKSLDSFKSLKKLSAGSKEFNYFDLKEAEKKRTRWS